MPHVAVNGVELYYEQSESTGPPVVFVHGAWDNHKRWGDVVPLFAEGYRVVTYDRRGHSQSSAPPEQGSVHEDVADLTGLIEALDLAPAHVIGNSSGSIIALRVAAARPELVRSLAIHEPSAVALLEGDDRFSDQLIMAKEAVGNVVEHLEAGDHKGGAKLFLEELELGPGAWEQVSEQVREMFIENAPTFLEEVNDPAANDLPMSEIQQLDKPVLLTQGGQSAPLFGGVIEQVQQALPQAQTHLFESEGHMPHTTNPDTYAATVIEFLDQVEHTPSHSR
jgi:pimeloyl-ACP methyl ester carboxylesterase